MSTPYNRIVRGEGLTRSQMANYNPTTESSPRSEIRRIDNTIRWSFCSEEFSTSTRDTSAKPSEQSSFSKRITAIKAKLNSGVEKIKNMKTANKVAAVAIVILIILAAVFGPGWLIAIPFIGATSISHAISEKHDISPAKGYIESQ